KFFFSSRRRHTRFSRDWSSDVCSSDLMTAQNETNEVNTRLKTKMTSPVRKRFLCFGASISRYTCARLSSPLIASSACPSPIRIRSEERRVGKEYMSGVLTYY